MGVADGVVWPAGYDANQQVIADRNSDNHPLPQRLKTA
jgi:hypothetical protein